MNALFDFERARKYWRFAPSGEGKHDTAALLKLPDQDLENIWDRAFISRLMRYPEEDAFMRVMANVLKGKKVLSIGPGLGLHELYYQRHGARLTCSDIVESNLRVITRLAAIKGTAPVRTFLADENKWFDPAESFDVAFIYGSLMTMPTEQQKRLLGSVRRQLAPDGQIILMLYTWKFVSSTCRVRSPEEFDPGMFARFSDPSVGDEHCPWSDWHDDEKLLDLAGPGAWITHRQFWQNGLFVWYAIRFQQPETAARLFFAPDQISQGGVVQDLPLRSFSPAAAKTKFAKDGVTVRTGVEKFGYALVASGPAPARLNPPDALRVEVALESGGLSIGVLDAARQVFVNTVTVTEPGRHQTILPLGELPREYQVIFSNHRTDGPASSSFVVHKVELINRQSIMVGQLSVPVESIRIIGGPASEKDLTEFSRNLEQFPGRAVEACSAWIEADASRVWIAEPCAALAEFRTAPTRCLRQVFNTLNFVSSDVPDVSKIIWLLENRENRGLDDFEAEAVFAAFIDIDFLHQIRRGELTSTILIAGTLREDVIGLAYAIDGSDLRQRNAVIESLQTIVDHRVPIATVFVENPAASALLDEENQEIARLVRRVLRECGAALGLRIPARRFGRAMDDLVEESAPLRLLAEGIVPIDHVCVERDEYLSREQTSTAFRAAGIRYDSSLSIPASRRETARGPYIFGGYQPQIFDHLSPAGLWDEDRWLECPLWEADEADLPSFWRRRQNTKLLRLAQLLNFKRMEAFNLEMERSPSVNQRYHEYRVYNWPPPAPSPRTTLINGGHLADVERVRLFSNQCVRLSGSSKRVRVADHEDFFAAVTAESKRRAIQSVATALKEQLGSHEYLGAIQDDGLREDVQEFLRFLPSDLGVTLELASGGGQLGKTVLDRCASYAAIELNPALSHFARQRGLDVVIGNVHELPFSGGVFDSVIANNILEHLYDPSECLNDVRRILAPGGRLYALIPLDGLNRDHQLRSHVWKATEANIRQLFDLVGLRPVRMEVMNLYKLGINAAFPTCNGLVVKVDAERKAD